MKRKSYFLHLLGAAVLLLITNAAYAQNTLTWDANAATAGQTDGGGTWLTANQWWDGVGNVGWTSGDNAIFGNGGAGGTVSLGGSVTAGTININNFSGTYTFQGTTQSLTQSGGITIGSSAGNVIFRGTGASTALTLAGAGGITMNGSGLLTMRENVTLSYTGSTIINSGTVMINAGSKPTGNFHLNGGMLTDYYRQTGAFSGLGTGTNQIQIHGNSGFGGGNQTSTWRIGTAGSTLVWGASGEGTSTGHFNPTTFRLRAQADNNGGSIWGWVTIDNRLDLNGATRTIDVYQGGGSIMQSRATINSGITGTGSSSSLIKNGGGVLFIGGTTSNWGGATTINAGLIDFQGNNIASIGGGTGRNITIAAGAGARFNALSNAILNRIAETNDTVILMTGATANNLDLSSSAGATLPNAWLGNWASNGAKTELSGIITFGGSNYQLGARESSGLLGIVGTDRLTGSQGLIVGQTGFSSGVRVMLAGSNDFSGDTVINSGARLTLGNNLAMQNSALNVGSSGGNIAFNKAGTITGNLVTTSPTLGGLIGSRNLISVFSSTGGNNESNHTAAEMTGFTLNPGAGKHHVYSGSIGGFGTGAAGSTGGNSTLTITGSGIQELSGVHTYTGATSITGGTLLISGGNLNSTSGVSITGGTLKYNSATALTRNVTLGGGDFRYNSSANYSGNLAFTSGTLSGTNWNGSLGGLTIGSGQIISPGNSPGLTTTTDQTWAAGGTYVWEINSATGTAGTEWDLLSGSGTLSITAGSGTEFIIMITSLDALNAAGDALGFNAATDNQWLIADFGTEITTFAANKFTLNTSNFQNDFTGNFGIARGDSITGGNNSQIYITYTAPVVIPEPKAALLSAIGIILLFRRRRSNSKP